MPVLNLKQMAIKLRPKWWCQKIGKQHVRSTTLKHTYTQRKSYTTQLTVIIIIIIVIIVVVVIGRFLLILRSLRMPISSSSSNGVFFFFCCCLSVLGLFHSVCVTFERLLSCQSIVQCCLIFLLLVPLSFTLFLVGSIVFCLFSAY